MDLQERLIELSEYGVSFNVANGNFVIRIKYDDKWTIIQPDGKDISFYRDENDSTVYYYVAPITVSIDKIFSAIDETIDYNHELQLKIELFKVKMGELQELFAKESYDILNTLEFKLKKRKDKTKKEINNKPVEEKEEKKDDSDKKTITTDEPVIPVDKIIKYYNKKHPKKNPKKQDKISEIDEKISKLLNS